MNKKNVLRYEIKMGELKESIEYLKNELSKLKEQRKKTQKHIVVSELPEADRFKVLAPARKHFIDTIKMIAYRAETSMTIQLKKVLSRVDDARALLCEIYKADGDLIVDNENNILTVRIHHLPNAMSDIAMQYLLTNFNDSETIYPGTKLKIIYKLVSN